MKKCKGKDAAWYEEFGLEPERALMSNRPGIGAQYYYDHPDCMSYEYINISTESGGRKFRPPKYFWKLYERDHPEDVERVKTLRKLAAESSASLKDDHTDLAHLEMLEVEERALLARIKSLKREL